VRPAPCIARGLALRLAAGLAVLALAAGVSKGFADPAPYRGRRLVDVLAELKTQGLNLVYSSAVVGEDLRIEAEPRPGTGTRAPRALLEEILPPLGLEMQDGPAGSILILRSTAPPAGSIRGRVRSSAHGGPIAGAVVRVVGTVLTTPTRPDGSFEIAQVPAGVQEIVVESPGFSPATLGNIACCRAAVSLTVTLEGSRGTSGGRRHAREALDRPRGDIAPPRARQPGHGPCADDRQGRQPSSS
jgi:hypothetical protein